MSLPRLTGAPGAPVMLPPLELVDGLAPEALVDFATQAAALHARAMARLTTMGRGATSRVVDDGYLTADDVAELVQVSPEWVYKQAVKWSFAIKLAPKVLRIQRAGLLRWMAQRRR